MHQSCREFCFCFSLRKLSLLDVGESGWENYLRFRIEIYRNEHFVSATPDILCTPNRDDELIFAQQNVAFTLHLPDTNVKEMAEVRLYESSANNPSKLVGCYEFLLNNYIRAYQELSRNCIELRVQIAENYIIVYDVFVERTEEALRRLIQEHETARRFHMDGDDISEIDSFLPHEISNPNLDDIYQQLKVDDSHVPHHPRFYSPKRERSSDQQPPTKADNTHSTITSDHSRVHPHKIHKAISSADMSFALWRREGAEEVESQAETEDRYKKIEEVYRVIGSDSKIIQPDELEEHERARPLSHSQANLPAHSHKCSKKAAGATSTFRTILLVALIITLTAFLASAFQAPDEQYRVKLARGAKAKH